MASESKISHQGINLFNPEGDEALCVQVDAFLSDQGINEELCSQDETLSWADDGFLTEEEYGTYLLEGLLNQYGLYADFSQNRFALLFTSDIALSNNKASLVDEPLSHLEEDQTPSASPPPLDDITLRVLALYYVSRRDGESSVERRFEKLFKNYANGQYYTEVELFNKADRLQSLFSQVANGKLDTLIAKGEPSMEFYLREAGSRFPENTAALHEVPGEAVDYLTWLLSDPQNSDVAYSLYEMQQDEFIKSEVLEPIQFITQEPSYELHELVPIQQVQETIIKQELFNYCDPVLESFDDLLSPVDSHYFPNVTHTGASIKVLSLYILGMLTDDGKAERNLLEFARHYVGGRELNPTIDYATVEQAQRLRSLFANLGDVKLGRILRENKEKYKKLLRTKGIDLNTNYPTLQNVPPALLAITYSIIQENSAIARNLAEMESTSVYQNDLINPIVQARSALAEFRQEVGEAAGLAMPGFSHTPLAEVLSHFHGEARAQLLAKIGINDRWLELKEKPPHLSDDQWRVTKRLQDDLAGLSRLETAKNGAKMGLVILASMVASVVLTPVGGAIVGAMGASVAGAGYFAYEEVSQDQEALAQERARLIADSHDETELTLSSEEAVDLAERNLENAKLHAATSVLTAAVGGAASVRVASSGVRGLSLVASDTGVAFGETELDALTNLKTWDSDDVGATLVFSGIAGLVAPNVFRAAAHGTGSAARAFAGRVRVPRPRNVSSSRVPKSVLDEAHTLYAQEPSCELTLVRIGDDYEVWQGKHNTTPSTLFRDGEFSAAETRFFDYEVVGHFDSNPGQVDLEIISLRLREIAHRAASGDVELSKNLRTVYQSQDNPNIYTMEHEIWGLGPNGNPSRIKVRASYDTAATKNPKEGWVNFEFSGESVEGIDEFSRLAQRADDRVRHMNDEERTCAMGREFHAGNGEASSSLAIARLSTGSFNIRADNIGYTLSIDGVADDVARRLAVNIKGAIEEGLPLQNVLDRVIKETEVDGASISLIKWDVKKGTRIEATTNSRGDIVYIEEIPSKYGELVVQASDTFWAVVPPDDAKTIIRGLTADDAAVALRREFVLRIGEQGNEFSILVTKVSDGGVYKTAAAAKYSIKQKPQVKQQESWDEMPVEVPRDEDPERTLDDLLDFSDDTTAPGVSRSVGNDMELAEPFNGLSFLSFEAHNLASHPLDMPVASSLPPKRTSRPGPPHKLVSTDSPLATVRTVYTLDNRPLTFSTDGQRILFDSSGNRAENAGTLYFDREYLRDAKGREYYRDSQGVIHSARTDEVPPYESIGELTFISDERVLLGYQVESTLYEAQLLKTSADARAQFESHTSRVYGEDDLVLNEEDLITGRETTEERDEYLRRRIEEKLQHPPPMPLKPKPGPRLSEGARRSVDEMFGISSQLSSEEVVTSETLSALDDNVNTLKQMSHDGGAAKLTQTVRDIIRRADDDFFYENGHSLCTKNPTIPPFLPHDAFQMTFHNVARALRMFSDGFWYRGGSHIVGGNQPEWFARGVDGNFIITPITDPIGRYYVDLRLTHREDYMRAVTQITERARDQGIYFMFKQAIPQEAYARVDSSVIYFEAKDSEWIYGEITKLLKENPHWVRSGKPPLTARVLDDDGNVIPGLSFAMDTGRGESYGEKVSQAMASACRRLQERLDLDEPLTMDDVYNTIASSFVEYNIDPEYPAFLMKMNGSSGRDVFEFMFNHTGFDASESVPVLKDESPPPLPASLSFPPPPPRPSPVSSSSPPRVPSSSYRRPLYTPK